MIRLTRALSEPDTPATIVESTSIELANCCEKPEAPRVWQLGANRYALRCGNCDDVWLTVATGMY